MVGSVLAGTCGIFGTGVTPGIDMLGVEMLNVGIPGIGTGTVIGTVTITGTGTGIGTGIMTVDPLDSMWVSFITPDCGTLDSLFSLVSFIAGDVGFPGNEIGKQGWSFELLRVFP